MSSDDSDTVSGVNNPDKPVAADVDTTIDPDAIEYGMIIEPEDFSDEFQPRQRNYGTRQHRRFTGYDQNLPMVIYGYRKETVHGTGDDNSTPLTVIVFRWHLEQRKPGHRFKTATLRAIFATRRRKRGHKEEDDDGDEATDNKHDNGIDNQKYIDHYYDPHVAEVAPSGSYALEPTVTDVTVARTRTIEGTAEAGASAGPATAKAGGRVSYQLATTVTATDCVTIHGSERNEYDDSTGAGVSADRCNVAEWQLFENTATRSGLPSEFCTAVRLERRRRDTSEFTVRFEIDTKVDSLTDGLTKLKKFVGRLPRDEPIIFNPAIEEEGPLAAWKNRLDKKVLFEECQTVMYRSMAGRE